MRCNFATTLLSLCWLGSLGSALAAQTGPLPVSGQQVTLAGTLRRVEAGPHTALFAGDDGRQYVLDLSQAKITLPSSVRAPLTPGTRGIVSGLGNTDGSITVSRFQAAPAAVAAIPIPSVPKPVDFTVRGTVEVIDLERGAFVLRINTHTRTVFVTPDTDVSGLPAARTGFPVQPGQRVTVGGSLQPEGTVLAGLLTAKEDVNYHTLGDQPNRILFGIVSSPANKFGHRDIKIRLADGGGTETKIVVPRDIPVRRSGTQISVYDLSRRDQVRVTGRMSGTDFRAARIDVLAPTDAAPTNAPAADTPSARPGL